MLNKKSKFFVSVGAMAIVVTISNILVAYPINDWLTWATFTYPLAFFVTDVTNRILGTAPAHRVIFVGFIIGIILSLIFAQPRIAFASGTAFLVAQMLDVFIFDKLRRLQWWQAPLLSSTVSSAVDTILFFSLAFAGTTLPWITLGIGDYSAKLTIAILLLIPFRLFYKNITLVTTEIKTLQ